MADFAINPSFKSALVPSGGFGGIGGNFPSGVDLGRPISQWLPVILRRLRASVGDRSDEEHDGTVVTQCIERNAEIALSTIADLLVSAPYLSATSTGDLVAEFEGHDGSLILIVSDRTVLVFSTRGGVSSDHGSFIVQAEMVELRSVVSKAARILAGNDLAA